MSERVAILALEDGVHHVGRPIGAAVEAEGEVVFNTAMTGYQEVMTDPSYAGQMVVMTYPMIGNYGTADVLSEGEHPHVRALIVRELAPLASNCLSHETLDQYMRRHGVPGIQGVDTRALVRHLRGTGALRAVLVCAEAATPEAIANAVARARSVKALGATDHVGAVSCRAPHEWSEPLPDVYSAPVGADGAGLHVAVIDYGVKRNILRSLRSRGCRVTVMPSTATFEDVRVLSPDGVVLSNGPGDPSVLTAPVAMCRSLIGNIPLFGICLGHQILAMALGGTTRRLPFGHHGSNHPVRDVIDGRVRITSQNHEFEVVRESIPAESGFFISHENLNDGSVEGLAHPQLPVFSVQYHPEGCPGPQDNQYLFDRFIELCRRWKAGDRGAVDGAATASLPEFVRPRSVLVIGSGPIVIGQAAEFDFSGTQACRALREEGVRTILVNSNPATIMTDEEVADAVYIEPLTVDVLRRVIERERPDAVLPTLGGQTALNLAMELEAEGVLRESGVRLLGARIETIRDAEDREAFKRLVAEIGEPVPESVVVNDVDTALRFAADTGYPLVVRPGYTLGGTGGGIAYDAADLERICAQGLLMSPIRQVLIERYLGGWKELEYEVMRDRADNCITICNMENIDPMGVHTGDSIVVAPSQTLTDREYQMLRGAALRIIRRLGIVGGCNIQFALDPQSSQYYVIEVNPRVSRSSALASKATGYPIARVAAKLAIGMTLDQIPNQVTGRTRAAFEPSIDYCVVKIPRWPFDKFPHADRTIGTQMKSTGEVMAIERSFEAALDKAVRSLEQRMPAGIDPAARPELLDTPNDLRLFALLEALRQGHTIEELHERTRIDRWFLERMQRLARGERGDRGLPLVYKMVDTCAAEFEAQTPYYYSTHEYEDEAPPAVGGDSAIVIGSGPIRIGQGIEFDYCSVHGALALREAGVRSVMINCNPETVSTDFDTSDRLFFEPLDETAVAALCDHERPRGAIFQYGGQTAVGLADPMHRHGVAVLGSSVDAIDLAEDRARLGALLRELQIAQPDGDTTTSVADAAAIAERIGYPVLLRPSYVLGGRAMEIVHNAAELGRYMEGAVAAMARGPILIDKYLMGKEIEVDAISDGEDVLIPGIMEHIERAGVHSGDSVAIYPALGLSAAEVQEVVSVTERLVRAMKVVGLVNIQYVLHRRRLLVLEVNPRASRTVPFLSKVTGVPMVRLATFCALGRRLRDLGYGTGHVPPRDLVAVKAPVFSMAKLLAVDAHLGPEMKSTGEVMGIDRTLPAALHKAFIASGIRLPARGAALCTIADADKADALPTISGLVDLGYSIYATEGTARALSQAGVSVTAVHKIGEGHPDVVDVILDRRVDVVINTISNWVTADATSGVPIRDGYEIRRAAVERHIPCLTSIDTASALVESLLAARGGPAFEVLRLGEYLGESAGAVAREVVTS